MTTAFSFRHPDISLTVLRRRATDFLLDCSMTYLKLAATRAHPSLWRDCFASDTAFRSAVYRLRKRGVVVDRRARDGSRSAEITDTARSLRRELNPEVWWSVKWDGIWRVLVYDIDEKERVFRNGLRRFLISQRLGCLQQSVWVSPVDIRPLYADLQTTLNLDSVAYLFEARTVLGRSSQSIVRGAWDFDRLAEGHQRFVKAAEETLDDLQSGRVSTSDVAQIVRMEMAHYLSVMALDPLLPRRLLPADYLGINVYDLHKKIVRLLAKRL